jgi:hypothetical protein
MLEDFSVGEQAGKDLEFTLYRAIETTHTTTADLIEGDIYYKLNSRGPMENLAHRDILGTLARDYFPLPSIAIRKALYERFQTWVPLFVTSQQIFDDETTFARLQCFVLGYYYGALRQLVVDDQLITKEAFGSWGWWDKEIFSVIKDMNFGFKSLIEPQERESFRCRRDGLMRVAAYLFAGANCNLFVLLG